MSNPRCFCGKRIAYGSDHCRAHRSRKWPESFHGRTREGIERLKSQKTRTCPKCGVIILPTKDYCKLHDPDKATSGKALAAKTRAKRSLPLSNRGKSSPWLRSNKRGFQKRMIDKFGNE